MLFCVFPRFTLTVASQFEVLRAAYFAMKADLKARKSMHDFSRSYMSGLNLAHKLVIPFLLSALFS